MNKMTPYEQLKYSWSKEYLQSDDFKNFCKQLAIPLIVWVCFVFTAAIFFALVAQCQSAAL